MLWYLLSELSEPNSLSSTARLQWLVVRLHVIHSLFMYCCGRILLCSWTLFTSSPLTSSHLSSSLLLSPPSYLSYFISSLSYFISSYLPPLLFYLLLSPPLSPPSLILSPPSPILSPPSPILSPPFPILSPPSCLHRLVAYGFSMTTSSSPC